MDTFVYIWIALKIDIFIDYLQKSLFYAYVHKVIIVNY